MQQTPPLMRIETHVENAAGISTAKMMIIREMEMQMQVDHQVTVGLPVYIEEMTSLYQI